MAMSHLSHTIVVPRAVLVARGESCLRNDPERYLVKGYIDMDNLHPEVFTKVWDAVVGL